MSLTQVLAASPPAGGAALGEVFGATAAVGAVTALLLGIGVAHRTRRTDALARVADGVGRAVGRPGWVALPTVVASLALLTALFGMLWDIALHIGRGRDEGPLANPAHYFILVGLFGVFAAGMLAVLLPRDEQPGPAAVRLTRHWQAPVGGLLLAGAGFYALLGFPLDDVWHRLFGQDVTLWGPTHLMLIGGAGLSLIGILVLEQEGKRAVGDAPEARPTWVWLRHGFALGGMLIGLSVFQAEFDFGVPQFRLVLQPMMIAAAAGLALVAARLWMGRGAAIACVAFFLLVRGTFGLVVGPVLGEPTPSFPLYLGSALLIELLALTSLRHRALAFGAVGGLLVGTVGSATEAAWSYAFMTLPWTPDVWVEGLLMSSVVGVGAGLCGALLALGLQGRLPRPAVSRSILAGSVVALAAMTTNGLIATVPTGVDATVELVGAETGTARELVVRLPEGAVDDPAWLQVTAWQGGGDGLVVDRLEQTGPGEWRSTQPIPVDGSWKTLLRVHDGRVLAASAIFLPLDEAIAAEEVPALASSTRPVGPEIALLQRERDLDVPAWTWAAASLVVLACSIALVLAIAWGVGRLAARTRRAEPPSGPTGPATRPAAGTRRGALRPGVA